MYVLRPSIGIHPPNLSSCSPLSIISDRTKRVKDARSEAQKEIEDYKKEKEEEYKKYEKEVRYHTRSRPASAQELNGRSTATIRQQAGRGEGGEGHTAAARGLEAVREEIGTWSRGRPSEGGGRCAAGGARSHGAACGVSVSMMG